MDGAKDNNTQANPNSASDRVAMEAKTIFGEIKKLLPQKNFDLALQMMEGLIPRIESSERYPDDLENVQHQFSEFFEMALYSHLLKSGSQTPKPFDIPYWEIYATYGQLLMEKRRFEDARAAFRKALHWDPVSFITASEYIETYRMEGDMETFFSKTIEAFKIAIHATDVARCYRNLGYYFIEKKLFSEAVAVYLMSQWFDKNSPNAQAELNYISSIAGNIEKPSIEQIKQYSEKYGFPIGADKDIVQLAYAYGDSLEKDGQKQGAKYFFSIMYELTQEESIKKRIDSL